jgi:large subunit ribosomal protein L9
MCSAGGPVLDRRTIELPAEHIKSAGKHAITVRLHPEVTAQFTLEVVAAS